MSTQTEPSHSPAHNALVAVREAATPSRVLWGLALLLFVVGDTATTRYGMSIGLVEGNHAAGYLIGGLGFWPSVLGAKGLLISITAVQHYAYRRQGLGWVGLFLVSYLALLGLLTTTWNLWLIYRVL